MRRILAPLSVLLQLQLLLGVVTSIPTTSTGSRTQNIGQRDDGSEALPRNRALHESFEINHEDGSIIMPPTSNSVVNPSPATTSTLPATTPAGETTPTAPSTIPVKQENGVCPPCPQCVAGGDLDPFSMNNNNTIIAQEPLTMQILVVDSPGIITMGMLLLSALLCLYVFC